MPMSSSIDSQPVNKKAGEIPNMFDLVIAKLSALESNLKMVEKDIEAILLPPTPHPQSETSVSKLSTPLAVALSEVVERLNIMIEFTGELHERCQL